MLERIPLKNILFLDVETVPQVKDFNELDPALQDLWVKKAMRIAPADEALTPEELYFERAGIYSEFGKIVCISAGFFHGDEDHLKFRCKAYYSDDEAELLTRFAHMLTQSSNRADQYLCGHNAREFDFPYIARRMLINQIPLPDVLNIPGRKPWEITLLDTMDLWKFGDYKSYTSLALLAAVFKIPTPKDDIQGADVARVYWMDNDLKRIAVYCNKDVVTTARLYLKYSLKGELLDDNVELLL
ncbi:MAG: 3'-5' exonuclease [Bacteroidota bacterium]